MTTQFQLDGQPINIYEIEHYVVHMLSELHSKRNDGWVEEHYRNELSLCGTIIDDHLRKLAQTVREDQNIDWVKGYEYDKLNELRKRIDEIQRS